MCSSSTDCVWTLEAKKFRQKWRSCSAEEYTAIVEELLIPRINLIVDSTASHCLLSFMDANSGYN